MNKQEDHNATMSTSPRLARPTAVLQDLTKIAVTNTATSFF